MPKSYTRNVSCLCSSCFNNSGFIQGSSHCTGWEEEKLQRKLVKESKKAKVQPVTRRFLNYESRLLEIAITYLCNHCNIRFENTSKYVDTLTLFFQKLEPKVIDPRWPLTPCLLRSHVWLYPRIIVSKCHGNTSMYVDTVINFAANYHIHIHTYYVHTTYRMSDHIVSYWTQFRRDKNHWKSCLCRLRRKHPKKAKASGKARIIGCA